MPQKKIHFEISERKMILRLFDVVFVVGALYWIGTFFNLDYLEASVCSWSGLFSLVLYISIFGAIFEMYNLQVASNQFQVLKSTLLTVSTTVFVYLLTPIFSPVLPSNRLQIVVFYGVVFVTLIGWRLFYVRFMASNRFLQNAVLVCDQDQVEELIQGLENIDPHYKIIGYVSADLEANSDFKHHHFVQPINKNDLASFVKKNGIAEIVIASQKTAGITAELYQQLIQVLESGRLIREYTQVYESKTYRIPVQYIERDFYRFFPFSRNNHNKLYLTIIRFFEIAVSILGLVFCLAFIPFIAMINAIGNKGALFYTQNRVGKNGIVFSIFKFRSMKNNSESSGAIFSTNGDTRITAFGKFMRKTRVDEFPQFLNVLKGDMALIGPRPERPFFVKEISALMPFYETRHIIKPGLTGWAQVNYSYGESIDDSLIKLQYDLYYIKHRSFYLDFNIALKTITTVLFYRGQ